MRASTDWYLVLIVAAIVLACGGAVFYMTAFTSADPEWFKNIGVAGFGALIALLVPKSNPPQEP